MGPFYPETLEAGDTAARVINLPGHVWQSGIEIV